MNIQIVLVELEKILPIRDLYRQELDCQIVHDSAHGRKDCTQSFLIEVDGVIGGYAANWTGPYWMAKGSVFEFYLLRSHRTNLYVIFEEFLRATKPPMIYAQTNDPLLGTLIYDYVDKVEARSILFHDSKVTGHVVHEVVFRQTLPEERDRIFKHHVEPVGDWLLEKEGRIVATGGVLYHYNRPHGDIFMEVDEPHRGKGLGQFLVQELKRVCYQSGSLPCARTIPSNVASRRTLEQAGFAPCARLISGETSYDKLG